MFLITFVPLNKKYMYQSLIFFHSVFRWLVLASLIWCIVRSYKGYFSNADFSKGDNALRHWTATIAHIQLVLGIILYTQSQVIQFFWNNFNEAIHHLETTFFALLHMILMLIAIILITIGSAKAKRKALDKEKFKTLLLWFSVSLVIILIAIPWPFSPFAARPYFR